MAKDDPSSATDESKPLRWVGIGSSAGGLEALRTLARALPTEANATYVVAQHMAPLHRSLLSELIGRETSLPVAEVTDLLSPEPNHIYVTPPNSDVVVRDGRLHLLAASQEPGAPKPSVDRFFRTLAEELETQAVGVILSGTGSDGAYGIKAIRAAGGITIAQEQSSAEYNGMPLSAVETGCIDLVLRPEEIGAQFKKILSQPRDLDGLRKPYDANDAVSTLLQSIYALTRVDFRDYKTATVQRRIERRMTALALSTVEAYAEHTKDAPEELEALFQDLLISVTSFFRDREEFEALEAALKQWLTENKGQAIRVWVPGCATGEEAYTIAMVFAETMGGFEALEASPLQIFATDIDENAIATARRGVYPQAATRQVPQRYLEKYFQRTPDGYAVNKALRDRVVFSIHNICQDPPFLNIDLVSCRNLLIYFKPSLQTRVLSRLHYALNTNGLLFLGRSESVTGTDEMFRQLGSERRLFRRRVSVERGGRRNFDTSTKQDYQRRRETTRQGEGELEIANAMFDSLVKAVGPNCILVTSDLHIKRVYGDINPYLHLTPGAIRMTTSSLLRDTYRHEARMLLVAVERRREALMGVIRRSDDDPSRRVQLRVYPLETPRRDERLALLTFAEWREEVSAPSGEQSDASSSVQLAELERELAATRESLQQTVEELETSNEELQALNEELQSSNEELQSTNEELETANEELQSTNEELTTVNEELQINSVELTTINQELDSILANIAAPILVVDRGLSILRCSQRARQIFGVAPGVARPHISQCALPEGFPNLSGLLTRVIQTGTRQEAPARSLDEPAMLLAAPYFNPRGELIGATLIVSEISAANRADVDVILDAVPVMVLRKNDHDRIIHANAAVVKAADLAREALPGLPGQAVFGEDAEAEFEDDLRVIARNKPVNGDLRALSLGGSPRRLYRVFKQPQQGGEHGRGVFVTLTDVTEAEREVHALRLATRNAASAETGRWSVVPDTGRVEWTAEAAAAHGLDTAPADIDAWCAAMAGGDGETLRRFLAKLAESDGEAELEIGAATGGHRLSLIGLGARDAAGRLWAIEGLVKRLA